MILAPCKGEKSGCRVTSRRTTGSEGSSFGGWATTSANGIGARHDERADTLPTSRCRGQHGGRDLPRRCRGGRGNRTPQHLGDYPAHGLPVPVTKVIRASPV